MGKALCFVETPHRMGGAQRSLMAALTEISRFGWLVTSVFPSEGVVVDAYRSAGLDVDVLRAPERLLRFDKTLLRLGLRDQAEVFLREVLPYSCRFAQYARLKRADLLHFNNPRGVLMAGWAGPLSRRPVVLHVRGATRVLGPLKWAVSQTLATRIVLVADALRPCIAPRHRRRVRVVHNGVAVPPTVADRAAARAALAPRFLREPLAPREVLVVALSSFTPFKGLHHLLRAASAARSSGVPLRYLCAGSATEPDYERYLLGLRTELGLSDVVSFAGYVADPSALLAAADVLVLPSVDSEELDMNGSTPLTIAGGEGLPRAILEAMAHGLPVIASNVQGVAEQVEDGVSGRLVRPGDPAGLAAALVEFGNEPEFRARAGAAGRERAESRFSSAAAAGGLARVFDEAVRAGPRTSKPALGWC